jgi:hypothetical protein
MSGTDMVNSPDHYNQSDIECIDAIHAALGEEGFIAYCRGNAIKYNWRAGHKMDRWEDLRKAAWYSSMAAGDDPRPTVARPSSELADEAEERHGHRSQLQLDIADQMGWAEKDCQDDCTAHATCLKSPEKYVEAIESGDLRTVPERSDFAKAAAKNHLNNLRSALNFETVDDVITSLRDMGYGAKRTDV